MGHIPELARDQAVRAGGIAAQLLMRNTITPDEWFRIARLRLNLINGSGVIPGNEMTSTLPDGGNGPELSIEDSVYVQFVYQTMITDNVPRLRVNIGGVDELPLYVNVNIAGTDGDRVVQNLFPRIGPNARIALPDHCASDVFMRSTPISPETAQEIGRIIRPGGTIRLEGGAAGTEDEFNQVVKVIGANGQVVRNDVEMRDGTAIRVVVINVNP